MIYSNNYIVSIYLKHQMDQKNIVRDGFSCLSLFVTVKSDCLPSVLWLMQTIGQSDQFSKRSKREEKTGSSVACETLFQQTNRQKKKPKTSRLIDSTAQETGWLKNIFKNMLLIIVLCKQIWRCSEPWKKLILTRCRRIVSFIQKTMFKAFPERLWQYVIDDLLKMFS